MPSPRLRLVAALLFALSAASLAALAWRSPGATEGEAIATLGPFILAQAAVAAALALGRPAFGLRAAPWVGLLCGLLFAASGLLFFALLPPIAGYLSARRIPPQTPPASPELPHPFGRVVDAWYSDLLPLGWSASLWGAAARGAATCRWCGAPRSDPRHAAPEPGRD